MIYLKLVWLHRAACVLLTSYRWIPNSEGFPKQIFHARLLYLCIIWLNLHFLDFWCGLQANRSVHGSRIGGFHSATHYREVCRCTGNIALRTGVAVLQRSVHILKCVCEGRTKGEAQNCLQNQWTGLGRLINNAHSRNDNNKLIILMFGT